MKKILYVGSECMPFAATGGLGDVMGSLPAALKNYAGDECDVRCVIPLYDKISDEWRAQMKTEAVFTVNLSWRKQYCGILSLEKDGVIYYFVDNEYYFKRGALYGHMDDGERYAFFSLAVIEMLSHIGFYPDILHANDWQSAMTVVYLNLCYRETEGYENIKTVFTIHNIEYQGRYDMSILADIYGLDWKHAGLMEWDNSMNLMKAAIVCADRVTTVSPGYAKEIQSAEYAHGLESLLQEHSYKLSGILNGIDYIYNDPHSDPDIAKKYMWRSLKGKTVNKLALQRELGLPEREDVALYSIISRLVAHKGTDLVCEIGYKLMAEKDIQLVVLGTGNTEYENYFRELERQFPDKVRAMITYDRKLSKRIYAASDLFIMPSKSEPCGLSQMIASRYGAVPITRETGGLADSIKGYWIDKGEIKGNGFTFANYSSHELYDRICASYELYCDSKAFRKLQQKVMKTDFSWGTSAGSYMELYSGI
ncbi:MAG: glycogen synthase GlgA [Ruminococcaceae bacterium]|nr:glycogen synthase GlgA [Oscillospiraceae bacterium]